MDERDHTVSSEDRSYLYGDGLFETVRVRDDGTVRWLDRHVARLKRSAEALGYPDAYVEEAVVALESVCVRKSGLWRVTVSRPPVDAPLGGEGGIHLHHRPVGRRHRPALGLARGFYLPDDSLAEHKTTSFLRKVEARRHTSERGFDEALLVSNDGVVGEASCANIVALIDGEPVTPPIRGILPGVTREGVLELAEDAGEPIQVRELTVDELHRADEIALLSAGIGAVAAASLEGKALSNDWTSRMRERLP